MIKQLVVSKKKHRAPSVAHGFDAGLAHRITGLYALRRFAPRGSARLGRSLRSLPRLAPPKVFMAQNATRFFIATTKFMQKIARRPCRARRKTKFRKKHIDICIHIVYTFNEVKNGNSNQKMG